MTPKTSATEDLCHKFKQVATAVKNEPTIGRKIAAGTIGGVALGVVAAGHAVNLVQGRKKHPLAQDLS